MGEQGTLDVQRNWNVEGSVDRLETSLLQVLAN